MRVSWGMVLVLSLLATACGDRAGSSGKNEETKGRPAGRRVVQPATNAAETATAPDAESGPFRLQEIRLIPEIPYCTTPLTAEPVYSGVLPEGTEFRHEWIVNNKKVPEVTGAMLEPSHFKKKAWVSCRVVPTWPDGKKGDEVRSKFVRIANAPPTLTIPPLEPFQAPGEFRSRIQGVDPDGDDLTYELLAPLDQGIVLDAKSGALSWKLDPDLIKRLGDSVEIKVAVSDGDGEKVGNSFILQFTEDKQ